ncbi:MAG TPA: multidrug efflux SMR transporter [Porticoccaceae bacterium]|nr:multidrug efflux SMR transporter [Porticoccaceae bacterium]
MHWWYLTFAILAEVLATSALKAAEGFTRPLPSLAVAIGYGLAFYLLALTLKVVPVGVAYAIWSGVGTALVALLGWLLYGQALNFTAWCGLGLIVAGVVVVQLGLAPRGG